MEAVNQIEYNGALYNIQDTEAQKSLVYSQNEIDTGKIWIDGKKIYRKVMLLPVIAKGEKYQTDLSSLTASVYIQIYGFVKSAENLFRPLLGSDELSAEYQTYIAIIDNSLYLKNGVKAEILSGHVILEYTKTTN